MSRIIVTILVSLLSFSVAHQSYADTQEIDSWQEITNNAQQGNAKAQARLGLMYYQGEGVVSKNYKQAFYWTEKSAQQGISGAQALLGLMYSHGEGVPQDYKQAFYWIEKSAQQGFSGAQAHLGSMYY